MNDKLVDELRSLFGMTKDCKHVWQPAIPDGFKCVHCGYKLERKS